MKQFYRFAVFAAFACILLLVALPAVADSQVRIVRLSNLQGEVRIVRPTAQGSEKAILNMPITQGMSLQTGNDGRAEVEFEDGTVLQTAPASEISFDQLFLRSSGDKVSSIALKQGTAYFNIRRKGNDEFSITLADRVLPLTRQSRFRVIAGSESVRLAVFKGDLWVPVTSGGQIKVEKGEELTLNRADGKYLVASTASSEFDTWARERTEYHDRYYSAASYKTYPYYGRGDLGFYGNWYDIPGFGSIWRPNNVAYGWDPFSNGYWSWYPGSGYMWVSDYPWGWLPYRYGSWAYVSGWGWGWLPYGDWNTWRPVPGVINKPADYQRPQPPSGSTPSQTPVYVDNPPHHRPHPPARPPRVESPVTGVDDSPRGPHRGPQDGRPRDGSSAAAPRPSSPSSPVVTLPPARPPRLERQRNGFVVPPEYYGEGARGRYPSDVSREDRGGFGGARDHGGSQPSVGFGGAGSQRNSAAPSAGASPAQPEPRSDPGPKHAPRMSPRE